MPEPNGIAVEVRDLVKRFGDFVAVDHVTFQVRSGVFLAPDLDPAAVASDLDSAPLQVFIAEIRKEDRRG